MYRNGYLRMGSIREAELRIHVALLIVLALVGIFQRSPYGILAAALLVFVH